MSDPRDPHSPHSEPGLHDPMAKPVPREGALADAPPAVVERFDEEIRVRTILDIGIWLVVTAILSFAVSYAFYRGLSSYEKRTLDAKPSPLAAANAARVPPGPRLQPVPENELAAFRAAERARLEGWGWSDAAKQRAHVPVDKAIESVAAHGLPDFTASPAPAAPAPEGTPAP